jgi:hypothetical protein
MVTPEDVRRAGTYGPIDVGGRLVLVSEYGSTTVNGGPLPQGRWHEVSSADGQTVHGYIQLVQDEYSDQYYAFYPFAIGVSLGQSFRDYPEAIRHLAKGW